MQTRCAHTRTSRLLSKTRTGSREWRHPSAPASPPPDDYDAVLLLPCDQPAVTPFHLALLLASAEGQKEEKKIAASTYAGRTGAPAIFPQRCFPELLALEGDSGARQLLQLHMQDVVEVPLENGELDLDTPESLAAIRRIWSK